MYKTLLLLLIALSYLFYLHSVAEQRKEFNKKVTELNTDEYLKLLKYPVETHKIQTKDGYILTFFRTQAKNTEMRAGLPAVFWQHGLEDSSDIAVMGNQEEIAPALMLANIGFDVWLGNSRGNFYSNEHVKYKKIQREFWQFTFQHMAEFDLPAAFEYITEKTGKSKINYIGHSQGTMMMHAALALRVPSVISKVATVISLGPVATVGSMNCDIINKLAKDDRIYPTLDKLGIWDLAPKSKIFGDVATLVCKDIPILCKIFLHSSLDLMPNIDNFERIEYAVRHTPMGSSLLNLHHFQQLVNSDLFQMYDYGSAAENMKYYNQTTPPLYDMSKIQEAVHLFAGDTDVLADPVDVVKLYHSMTNSQGKSLNMYHLGHMTFLLGKNKEIMHFMDDVIALLDIKQ